MTTSVVVPDIPTELARPKSAWHSFVLDRRMAFARFLWYLVTDEALVDCVMSRALTRLERTPFDSSNALINYNQAHSVLISEALAELKETRDGVPEGGVPFAAVNVSDHSDLRRPAFPPKQGSKPRAHQSLPNRPYGNSAMFCSTKTRLPREACGICFPDTPLVSAATEFVSRFTPLWLMNHLLRTYVSAELLGRKDKLKYNQEILYLSAIMHDLGLTNGFAGSQRFELDGADAASQFLLRQGVPKAIIGLVWNAISFHTSSGIYDRTKPEIALLGFGVLAAFPKRIAEIVGRKPQTAIGNFAADGSPTLATSSECGSGRIIASLAVQGKAQRSRHLLGGVGVPLGWISPAEKSRTVVRGWTPETTKRLCSGTTVSFPNSNFF